MFVTRYAPVRDCVSNIFTVGCPFCRADREFRISPENDKYAFGCFKCKKRGDTVQLVAEVYRCTPTEAAQRIMEKFGNNSLHTSPDPEVAQLTALRERLLDRQNLDAALMVDELIAKL